MMQERKGLDQEKDGGETPGRYHLLRLVGRSSSGETWLADDPLLHRQVAIKVLPPQNQHDSDYAAHFGREAHSLAQLNHPHILPVHDYGEYRRANGQVVSYLVMPFIESGSLDSLLRQRHLSPQEVLILLSQAAEALDYAHAQGALHYALKPTNMLLLTDLRLLLADFGIARIVSDSQRTASDITVEMPDYLAPEQSQGQATAASDRYSLAVVAYRLLTGHLPFQAKKGTFTLSGARTPPVPVPPHRLNPALPLACEEVLRRGLARQPEDRYPSAHEFVEALSRSLAAPLKAERKVMRRNLLIGAGLTIFVGGSVWATISGHVPFIASLLPSSPAGSQGPHPDEPAKILRGHQGPVHALAWSPLPGRTILASAGNEDSTVKLWDLQTFPQQQTVIDKSSMSKDLRHTQLALAWSPDGHSLAIGGSDNQGHPTISVYGSDLNGPAAGLEQGLALPASTLNGLGWMKQTFLVALSTPAQANGQRFWLDLWDTRRPSLKLQPASIQGLLSPSGDASIYRSLAVSPDGTRLAIGTTQGALVGNAEPASTNVHWQPASFSPLQYHQGTLTDNAINELTWSASGNTLFSIMQGHPNAFVGWSIDSNPPGQSFQITVVNSSPNFTAIALYPNTLKSLYAAGTQDGLVYLWDEQAGQLPMRILKGGSVKGRIMTLAWSPDGAWLAASYDDSDASIAIWGL